MDNESLRRVNHASLMGEVEGFLGGIAFLIEHNTKLDSSTAEYAQKLCDKVKKFNDEEFGAN